MHLDLASLNRQQVGRVGEYLARIAFAQQGWTIYTPDVDDSGVDLLAHRPDRGYVRVQVKSLRKNGYVFMRKRYFDLSADMAVSLVLFQFEEPRLFLIPALTWLAPCSTFVDRDYEGLKSEAEFGINVSDRNLDRLMQFAFGQGVAAISR